MKKAQKPRERVGERERERESGGIEGRKQRERAHVQLHDVPLIMQHRWTGHGQFVGRNQRL